MTQIRVRFAPSPTGALHIGGVRTALYNYLFARQQGGVFVLRIEDTDQSRYVKGAEEYIIESLKWLNLVPDEGPGFGGDYGPYSQSERKAKYEEYGRLLVERGFGYYAFDTAEDLEAARQQNPNFKYDPATRQSMKNSLSLSPDEVEKRLGSGDPYVIRLKVPQGDKVEITDRIRGEVVFQTDELDDKVMLKSDGMPTYHMANVVDDHLMKITHVIRGEEWLPSTAHHVLLYRAFGWEDTMPEFAHLPLILKPDGKGKLSKRDGVRLGIPVFPLSWNGDTAEDSFTGFREEGYLPEALINFLAFLGWNPGTEQEIFSIEELVEAFSLEKIGKGGARFDIDKAKWFNQQYILTTDDDKLKEQVRPILEVQGAINVEDDFFKRFIHLMKERATVLRDFWDKGYYFFSDIRDYDDNTIRKKWKSENLDKFRQLYTTLEELSHFDAGQLEVGIKNFMESSGLKAGEVMPVLRLATTGSMQGPPVYEAMELMGKEKVLQRLNSGFEYFEKVSAPT